jgi:uncharacterized repeat protein (TIGR01451 family)
MITQTGRIVTALIFVIAAFVLVTAVASAATIWVPEGGNQTIQQAVDNASANDIIIVRNGTYTENVVVNKANLTIRSENGSASCIVTANNISKDVFNITESYVNITGFTVRAATSSVKACIYLEGVAHCNILNNTVSNKSYGIHLSSSSNNILTNNTASNNSRGIYLSSSSNNNTLAGNIASYNLYGIYLVASSNYNNLTGNTVNSNTYRGIYLGSSSNNILTNNTANSDNQEGIRLSSSSSNNTLAGNTASNNQRGIYLDSSSNNNTLAGNNVSNNAYGIHLSSSSNNNLTNNTASDNEYVGIHLQNADNNNLTGNTANDNGYEGIYLAGSDHNNLIGNEANSNGDVGIQLEYSHDNNLTGNKANSNWEDGIYLAGSDHNNLLNNTANSNDDEDGISLYDSDNNNLTGNEANSNEGDGIYLAGSDHNNLTGNKANWNEGDGIDLYNESDHNNLIGNTANSNEDNGINLYDESDHNNLIGNEANSNWDNGINLDYSSDNNLIGNEANSNEEHGISLYDYSHDNNLTGNTANSNGWSGILLYSFSDYNNLTGNTANSNGDDGISLYESSYNNLTGNRVTDNHIGIYLYNASENTITCNAVYMNTRTGFYLREKSENNTIARNGIVANGWPTVEDEDEEEEEEKGYNFINDQNVTVNATYNYWGTTVPEEIAARIYDNDDDVNLGKVTYEYFLEDWPLCAPSVPVLEVTKTVWNGSAWVKEVEDAHLNDTVRFNCTITNVGAVNLTQLRFWDILDCSLLFAGNATLKNESGVVSDSIVLEGNYTFKPKVLHPNNLSWDPYNPSDYEGFTELCPDTGHSRALWGWEDTNNDSRISTCDQINLSGAGILYSYHVEHVPYTLNVTNNETGESMYLESVWWSSAEPEVFVYEDYEVVDLSEPDDTCWIEVGWTEACCGGDWYRIEEWNDTDEDLNLSVNDTIQLNKVGTGNEEVGLWYTVTGLTPDLVVSREWEVDDFVDPDGLLLEPKQSLTLEYNATDIRCGLDTNTFVAKGLYEGNWTYSNEDSVDVEVPPRPAVETNLTVWNGTAWVKAVTVLVNDTLNFSWLVHNNGTCCDLEDIVGTLTFGSNETGVDDIENLAPCSEANGTLEVLPALECGTYTVWWNVSADCEEAEETVTAEDTVTVTVACPELEVNKTVWNGEAWVKAVNASINENVRFNCTITNTGNVNMTQLRFWDILDCSLMYAGNATLTNESGVILRINLTKTPYRQQPYNYTFKQRVLHPADPYWDPYTLSDCQYPYSTKCNYSFFELCPEAGKPHYLHGWDDTNNDSRVSACDQLWLESYEEWYHVDNVPYTLLVNNTATNESMYLDSVLDYEALNLSEPNGTAWTEVCWREACCGGDHYNLSAWYDTNNTGYLNVNDTLVLQNTRTGEVAQYTVEEVAIDLVVSMEWEVDHLINNSKISEPLDQSQPTGAFALETVLETNRVTGPIDPLNLFVLEPGQSITIKYNAKIIRCGVDNNTFRAKGNYSNIWTYSNEDVVTITVPCPSGYGSDSGGTEQELFYTDETVYATGSGFIPNSEVDIYITEDKHWVEGTPINSTIYAQKHNVTTDGNGNIIGEEIWPNPDPGEYDIVYDTNNNMKFDLGVDAAHNENDPGIIVLEREKVPALTPLGIAALIGLLSVIAISTIERKKKR